METCFDVRCEGEQHECEQWQEDRSQEGEENPIRIRLADDEAGHDRQPDAEAEQDEVAFAISHGVDDTGWQHGRQVAQKSWIG